MLNTFGRSGLTQIVKFFLKKEIDMLIFNRFVNLLNKKKRNSSIFHKILKLLLHFSNSFNIGLQ